MQKEIVPQVAFDRLFRSGKTRVSGDDTSVLDLVREQAQSIRSKGSKDDQARRLR